MENEVVIGQLNAGMPSSPSGQARQKDMVAAALALCTLWDRELMTFLFPFPLLPVLVFISAAFPTPAAVEARSSQPQSPSSRLGHAPSVPAAARSPVWPVPRSGAPAC